MTAEEIIEVVTMTLDIQEKRRRNKLKQKEWIHRAEALRLLKSANIGRHRFEKLVNDGKIQLRKIEPESKNSRVDVKFEDILKLLQ